MYQGQNKTRYIGQCSIYVAPIWKCETDTKLWSEHLVGGNKFRELGGRAKLKWMLYTQ